MKKTQATSFFFCHIEEQEEKTHVIAETPGEGFEPSGPI
jgi:hypothetical protein